MEDAISDVSFGGHTCENVESIYIFLQWLSSNEMCWVARYCLISYYFLIAVDADSIQFSSSIILAMQGNWFSICSLHSCAVNWQNRHMVIYHSKLCSWSLSLNHSKPADVDDFGCLCGKILNMHVAILSMHDIDTRPELICWLLFGC